MLYSPGHRFLFVHIPKTGGTSLRAALKPLLYSDPWYWLMWPAQRLSHLTGHRTVTKFPRHAKIIAAIEMLPPEHFAALFKFTVVRNPWDLQVSSFHHLRKELPHAVEGLDDFTAVLKHKFDPDRAANFHLDISSTPQMAFLQDDRGRLRVDYVARFENLAEDYATICDRLGGQGKPLPHKRKGQRHRDYRSYYTDETAEIVRRAYARDLEAFGYTFDDAGATA